MAKNRRKAYRDSEEPWGYRPPHPNVNWNIIEQRGKRNYVQVTCPVCRKARMLVAANVAFKIKWGAFTSHCSGCRAKGMSHEPVPVSRAEFADFDVTGEAMDISAGGLTAEGRRLLNQAERSGRLHDFWNDGNGFWDD